MATAIPTNTAPFSVWELAAASGGDITRLPDEHLSVAGVVTDSRAVVPGNAFLALPGESFDGHAYVGAAVERGASAVVLRRGREAPRAEVAVVEVDDVVSAFGAIARCHLHRWRQALRGRARVVAITGSAGKTTTKELVRAILSAVGACHATVGNLNNRIGLPAVALGLTDEPYAVFELGMSVPGEIAALAGIVEADVAVLLNVGVAHAEGFGGSRSGIAREKGSLFASLGTGAIAVVNVDDEAAHAQLVRTRARAVGFGRSPGADVRLVGREVAPGGLSRVKVDRAGRELELLLPVPGEAVALDLVAAIATADAAAGEPIDPEVLARAVGSWQPSPGRSVTFEVQGDIWVLDDSYNANPASMRAAFATLTELRASGRGRAVAVLGEMRELGPLSHAEHEALGAELCRHGVNLVVGCGGAIDRTLARAEQGGLAVRRADTADRAGEIVAAELRPGDVVLFKGSRGAAVERALAAVLGGRPRVPSVPRGGP